MHHSMFDIHNIHGAGTYVLSQEEGGTLLIFIDLI